MPHDDCDIITISMKLTENEEQVSFNALSLIWSNSFLLYDSICFKDFNISGDVTPCHYDGRALSGNPGLQYPNLHGPVHTRDNNRWDTPPV